MDFLTVIDISNNFDLNFCQVAIFPVNQIVLYNQLLRMTNVYYSDYKTKSNEITCPVKTFQSDNLTCINCEDYCGSCFGIYCFSCKPGYSNTYFAGCMPDNTNTSIFIQNFYFFPSYFHFAPCYMEDCSVCFESSIKVCFSCDSGYDLVNNSCQDQNLIPNCLIHDLPKCNTCEENYFLSANKLNCVYTKSFAC